MPRPRWVLLLAAAACLGACRATPTPAADAGAPAPPGACPLRPACDGPLPDPGPLRAFRHTRLDRDDAPRHRVRDAFLSPEGPQWLTAKLAYGKSDADLEDEDVDVYVQRACAGAWEKVATARTIDDAPTTPPPLPEIEGQGGRIYVDLAAGGHPLPVGRHRVRVVVAGDLSHAEGYVEVLPKGARIVVSDVDGTLTEGENAAFVDGITGGITGANPGAAEVLTTLARHGYFIFYLTARPEWFTQGTRDWLAEHGFPPGLLHTTTTSTGALGGGASAFKARELSALRAATGLVPEYAFGNKPSDVEAYEKAGIAAGHAFFFKLDEDDDAGTGVRHGDYTRLVSRFAALPDQCP